MRKCSIIAVAAAAGLTAVTADMVEANFIPQRSEAELLKMADLAVFAEVVDIGVTVSLPERVHYVDEQGVVHVPGFRNPCIRARVVERMKGRSDSMILVCTAAWAEASALPPRGRRVSMFLRGSNEVWVEVPGAGFRERRTPAGRLVTVPCAFNPAFFRVGSARLVNEWMEPVERGYLAHFEVFSPSSHAEITLMGIAADGGSERANQRLARRRAEAVRRFLVDRGVGRERVRIVTRHSGLAEWPISSTHGRAVVIDVRMPGEDLFRLMPPGGPIC